MRYNYDSVSLFQSEFICGEQTGELRKFVTNHPGLGRYVIEHAYAVFSRYPNIWDSIVDFATNYAGVLEHYTRNETDIQDKWHYHAMLVRTFMTGA
jgi:hypothetical protein